MAARRRLRDWAFGLAVASPAICCPTPVRAQPAPSDQGFALDYRATAECPDGLGLVRAIQARSPRATLVEPSSAALRLKVELEPQGPSRLWVDVGEGAFRRDLPSASCADTLASIAVIVSMVLEAEPASRRAMAEGLSDAVPPSAADMPPTEEPPPEEPPPPPPPLPPPKALARPVTAVRSTEPAPRARTFAVAVSGGVMLETGVAPSPPLGAALGGELWWRPREAVAPGLQAELLATDTTVITTSEGTATFQLLAARLKVCVLRVAITSSVRVIPLCAAFEAGSLRAEGGGRVRNARRASMPWLATGLAFRAQWDVLPVFALEASTSITALLRQDTFVFRPGSLVYDVPLLSVGAGLGLSMRLH